MHGSRASLAVNLIIAAVQAAKRRRTLGCLTGETLGNFRLTIRGWPDGQELPLNIARKPGIL